MSEKQQRSKPISYADIVAELKAAGDYQDPMVPPAMPAEHPGYVYAAPDPMAQAAHFAQRQEAARQLAGPVSPVLELPEDAAKARKRLSLIDQLITAWRR